MEGRGCSVLTVCRGRRLFSAPRVTLGDIPQRTSTCNGVVEVLSPPPS